MFKALLIICGPLFGSECLQVEDTFGPYDTHPECLARVAQMYGQTQRLFPVVYTDVKYKCESSL